MGKLIGYARVSKQEQDIDMQTRTCDNITIIISEIINYVWL